MSVRTALRAGSSPFDDRPEPMSDPANRKRAGILLLMIGAILFLANIVLLSGEVFSLNVIAGLLAGLGITLFFISDVRTP